MLELSGCDCLFVHTAHVVIWVGGLIVYCTGELNELNDNVFFLHTNEWIYIATSSVVRIRGRDPDLVVDKCRIVGNLVEICPFRSSIKIGSNVSLLVKCDSIKLHYKNNTLIWNIVCTWPTNASSFLFSSGTLRRRIVPHTDTYDGVHDAMPTCWLAVADLNPFPIVSAEQNIIFQN